MPADRRSPAFIALYAIASAGGVIAYLPLLTLLLPVKIEALAGDARIGVFTATVICGALASSVSNIVFGWLSDRSVARGGGRRGWVAFGIGAVALSYAAVAAADSARAIILAIVLFQAAVNALLAPLGAMMADEIPDVQKGLAGGLLALGVPLASLFSTLLVGAAMLGPEARFAGIAIAVAVTIAPLLLTRARLLAPASHVAPERLARSDLALAWGARLLMQVAGNVLSLYLVYYFESVAPGTPPLALAGRVAHLLTLVYILPLPFAVLAGRLSDRTGRRKPVLLGAAATAAAGLIVMALARDWTAGAIGLALYASGSAVFLALHSAFAMLLLPDPAHRGRDLGLLNLTNTLPALLGPALTWWLATPHDFGLLMATLAALTLGGGLVVLGVRGRR